MSEVKVNKISPRTNCGTTTLGDSGDSFVIPSGVTITNNGTQTGFGRTGTVDWQTTVKTTGFTASSGEGYFCNTTSGAFTVTLPASPSAGDIVAVKDYANTFDTNNLTIGRNSEPIEGSTSNATIDVEGQSVTLVYIDGTQGWKVTDQGKKADISIPEFVTATGGTITTCGNFKIHTFTGPGTFCVSNAGNSLGSNTLDYLVVAGGAAGGIGYNASGGGGGAGGLRFSASTFTAPPTSAPRAGSALTASATGYPITVGAGGTVSGPGNPNGVRGNSGANSVFSTITSTGGGGGGGYNAPISPGNPGGSGGGGGGDTSGGNSSGGSGNTPPVSPSQGNNGGGGFDTGPWYPAGGGGGAGAAGASSPAPAHGSPGGVGLQINIDTNTNYWAGGGGGAGWDGANGGNGGLGGGGGGATYQACGGSGGGSALNPGGAGNGNWPSNAAGGSGGANTGGGAGGNNCTPATKGNGGSGIVIIRYKFQ